MVMVIPGGVGEDGWSRESLGIVSLKDSPLHYIYLVKWSMPVAVELTSWLVVVAAGRTMQLWYNQLMIAGSRRQGPLETRSTVTGGAGLQIIERGSVDYMAFVPGRRRRLGTLRQQRRPPDGRSLVGGLDCPLGE